MSELSSRPIRVDDAENSKKRAGEEEEDDNHGSDTHRDEDGETQYAVKSHINKFQLLEMMEGDGDEDDDDERADSDHGGSSSEKSEAEATNRERQQQPTKQRKPRRRRNKNKSNKISAQDDNNEFDLDDLEARNSSNQEQSLAANNQSLEVCRYKMLKLDMRNLLPEAELKRIFGKGVVKEDKTRDRIRQHAGANIQRSRFVSSGYYETKSSSGPKMELDDLMNRLISPIESDRSSSTLQVKGKAVKKQAAPIANQANLDSPIYFKFVHDKSYQEMHKLFLEAVNLGHPDSIVQNLNIYPAHTESLIQLSHMIRVSEDYKSASEFIEKALIVFEKGFHPRFNVASATCRLSYRRPENRAFFIALFKHITYCNRRGLRRTPFEYSKLLLSLEPDNDPLLASQLLDFFAIRAEEYDFVIEFVSKWHNLARLPNMLFSLALAHYMKSRCTKQPKASSDKSLQLADECLVEALLKFPNFIIPLLDACSAEPDSELKKCDYFDYSVYSTKYKLVPETVDVLVNLYVKRNFILWKQKHVSSWLERVVASMVSRFASGELKDQGQQTSHWASFKKPVPRNLLRHIVLSDLELKIPASAAGTSFLDIDPYPPLESIKSYDCTISGTQRMMPEQLTGGISSLFLRSIMPSFGFEREATGSSSNGVGPGHRLGHASGTNGASGGPQELSIGDFVIDDDGGGDSNPGTADIGLSELHQSIRGLADSITGLLSLAPLVRANRGEQSGGQQPTSTSNNRNNESNTDEGPPTGGNPSNSG